MRRWNLESCNAGVDHLVYLIDVAEGDTGGIALDASAHQLRRPVHRVLSGSRRSRGSFHHGPLDKHLHDRPDATGISGGHVVTSQNELRSIFCRILAQPGVSASFLNVGPVWLILRSSCGKGIPAVALEDSSLFAKLLWIRDRDRCV